MRNVIVIGASAGGVEALAKVVAVLPDGFPAAILIVMHVGAHPSILPALLGRASRLPVRHAVDNEPLRPATILVAPPDRHLLLEPDDHSARVLLSRGPKENHARPAVDPLFRSCAAVFGSKSIGVVLTGFLDDGTVGLKAIKSCGGIAVVQDPADAVAPDMPRNALENVAVDYRVPLKQMGETLVSIVHASGGMVRASGAAVPEWVRIENQFVKRGADMDELKKIATPSTFTCPDCGGALWQLHDASPPRFRCHTGHGYTLQSLLDMQEQKIEEAIWVAVRALQEKEKLAEQRAWQMIAEGDANAARAYTAMASNARDLVTLVRKAFIE
jgi:two-component system chemotaxis response regulator CheB